MSNKKKSGAEKMKMKGIIIRIFEFIGVSGVLLTNEIWQKALYLLLFSLFFYTDCKDYFKKQEQPKK